MISITYNINRAGQRVVAGSNQNTPLRKRLWQYLLIVLALYLPFTPYWYYWSKTGGRLTLAQVFAVVITGSLLLLGGAYLIRKFVKASAKSLVALDSFAIGLGTGTQVGYWAGLSDDAAVFPGLAGALVLTLSLLHFYDRIVRDIDIVAT